MNNGEPGYDQYEWPKVRKTCRGRNKRLSTVTSQGVHILVVVSVFTYCSSIDR